MPLSVVLGLQAAGVKRAQQQVNICHCFGAYSDAIDAARDLTLRFHH